MEVAKLAAPPNLEVRFVSCNKSAIKRWLSSVRDSRTLIVQVLIGAMHGLVVSILVIRNFALKPSSH